MKTETENLLPKMIPGTIHTQFVKCGKQNCRCARGELHGTYYYHFVRVNGKLRKRYLKASEVEEIQKGILQRQSMEKERREDNRVIWQLLRKIRDHQRELRSLYILKEQSDDFEK